MAHRAFVDGFGSRRRSSPPRFAWAAARPRAGRVVAVFAVRERLPVDRADDSTLDAHHSVLRTRHGRSIGRCSCSFDEETRPLLSAVAGIAARRCARAPLRSAVGRSRDVRDGGVVEGFCQGTSLPLDRRPRVALHPGERDGAAAAAADTQCQSHRRRRDVRVDDRFLATIQLTHPDVWVRQELPLDVSGRAGAIVGSICGSRVLSAGAS